MSGILNPWPGLQRRPYTGIRSITIRIPTEVADRIERVFGGAGFLTGVTHTIIKAIDDELQRTNTHSYNPDLLYDSVRRLSAALSAGEVAYSNVPGGVAVVHSQPAADAPSADVKGQSNNKAAGKHRAGGVKGVRRQKGG